MTKHEFIFSDQRKHRIARHVIFWLIWCVAFNVLFHFPVHVFKEWNASGPGTKNFQELGPVLFFVKALIVNSLLAVVLPQIILTYVVIYWLLPKYYFKRKNILLTLFLTVLVLIAFDLMAIATKHVPGFYNTIMGIDPRPAKPLAFVTLQWIVMTDQLSSLPIVLGFALAIKFLKRWWLKQKQTAQLAKEKTNAELQLLKAQVHPHFLFNTLNNIYSFMLSGSSKAPDMIKRLSGLLNYILNECNQAMVPLEKEIRMIEDYMALEKIRYAEHMQLTIDIRGEYQGKLIAPLLLIPFVENSFKHGASKMITHPVVKLSIHIVNNRMQFIVTNNKPLTNEAEISKGAIGLRNVRKRLALLYPGGHELSIAEEPGIYTVQLNLHLQDLNNAVIVTDEIKIKAAYAMA